MIYTSIKETALDSGLRVITEKVANSPAFVLGISIRAGASSCDFENQGIAHNLEHLIFRRSGNGENKAVAEKFESLGAYINAFTTHESTMFYVRALNENLEAVFELLCELLVNAEFNEKINEKERKVILEEIYSAEDEPEEFIFDEADITMFGNHPFGYRILGTEESLSDISINDLQDFYNRYYVLNNAAVTCVGDIEHERIAKLAEEKFKLPVNRNLDLNLPKFNFQSGDRKLKMSIKQAHVVYGKHYDLLDRKKASLASILVGDGMSSRLYQEIRENRGLVYNLYSTLQSYSAVGLFYVYMGYSPQNSDEIFQVTADQFELLADKGVSYEEYKRALEMVKTGYAIEMEDLSVRATRLAKYAVFGRKTKSIQEDLEEYRNIDFDELNEFIKSFFNFSNWNRTRLGK